MQFTQYISLVDIENIQIQFAVLCFENNV